MDGTSTIDRRFPNENPYVQYVLYLMYHVVSSFFELLQTDAFSSGPRSGDADGYSNMKLKYFERFEDDSGANTYTTCIFLPNRFSSTSQHLILIDQLLSCTSRIIHALRQ